MFTGLSLLRKEEKKTVEQTEKAKQLKSYLDKVYGSGSTDAQPKKKKKKRKPVVAPGGVKIMDEDVSGFAAVKADEEEEEEDDGACFPCTFSVHRSSSTLCLLALWCSVLLQQLLTAFGFPQWRRL
jgi:hypothetical protein